MTRRLNQIMLVVSFVAFSWLAMQAVHELGHVAGAWVTGGQVKAVVLHPAEFSRTDVFPNPRPTVVAWAGPVVGSLLPVLVYLVLLPFGLSFLFMARFFAGFCLLANGLYLSVGSFEGVGDAGDLLLHGAAQWQLILFGLAAVPAGLALWHGNGAGFGLGKANGEVAKVHVVISLGLLGVLLMGEWLAGVV